MHLLTLTDILLVPVLMLPGSEQCAEQMPVCVFGIVHLFHIHCLEVEDSVIDIKEANARLECFLWGKGSLVC